MWSGAVTGDDLTTLSGTRPCRGGQRLGRAPAGCSGRLLVRGQDVLWGCSVMDEHELNY